MTIIRNNTTKERRCQHLKYNNVMQVKPEGTYTRPTYDTEFTILTDQGIVETEADYLNLYRRSPVCT